MDRPRYYDDAVRALAVLLANEEGEDVMVGHINKARQIVWPHLSLETQSKLVLR